VSDGRLHPPYTPPPDAPVRFAFRFIGVLLAIPVVALALVVLPDGPVWVALRALIGLVAVGAAVGIAMTRRHDLEKPPGRDERPTPS
jgi:hypothetical protein